MQNMRQPIYPSNPADLELFESAREVLRVRGRSDKNSVGAAVRTDKGIFIGLDLRSRKSAICAEPGAISAAYSAGGFLLESIVAVCRRGDEEIVAISPCGACRELLNFHAPDCRALFQYEDSWVDLEARELFRYPIIFGLTMEHARSRPQSDVVSRPRKASHGPGVFVLCDLVVLMSVYVYPWSASMRWSSRL